MQEENSEILRDFAFRLDQAATRAGKSQADIAGLLGHKNTGRINNWFQARNFPRSSERPKLAEILQVRTEWLYQGQGDPQQNSDDPAIEDLKSELSAVAIREVPLISWTHAGQAANYEAMPKHWHGKIPAVTRDPKAFALTIEGDCMEPKFSPGDVVVLEPSGTPRNGKPVVAKLHSDEVLIRIYTKLPSGIIKLASLRPEIYPTIDYEPDAFHWIFPVVGLYRPV